MTEMLCGSGGSAPSARPGGDTPKLEGSIITGSCAGVSGRTRFTR
jgi:hypothetical protein